jgi:hypothetical protein
VALTVLAETSLAADRRGPEIVDAATRATSILEAAGNDAPATAAAQFVLARILFEAEPERARALGRSARGGFEAGGPPFESQLAQVEAWLAAH